MKRMKLFRQAIAKISGMLILDGHGRSTIP